ncbi:CdaR family protein [Clostridium sp.]|uniref:CdaR family protein n=1 Tax=Clostridium sp. TaxID=1506 RepID=UPI001B524FB4|nr:CdaR family protein [Clostridium sp.]MBP3914975.1 hypothetical protein [Clostridium sp.]
MAEKNFKNEIITIIISFIAAMIIWLYVANMKNPIEVKVYNDVDVELINLDKLKSQDLSIMSNSINKIAVGVTGRFTDLQKFSSKNISASINLENLVLEEGTNKVNVNVSIDDPKISLVNDKTTLTLELQVEKIIHKDIAVTFQSKGNLGQDYVLGDVSLLENLVTCSGTKDDIDSIKQVVATVDISGKESSFTESSTIKALNKNGDELKGILFNIKEVHVEVPVYFKKEVPLIVQISKSPPEGHKLTEKNPETNKVTIYGDKEILDGITSIKTEPVDLSRRYYDFERYLDLVYPEGVHPLNKDLNNVYVSFIIEQTE